MTKAQLLSMLICLLSLACTPDRREREPADGGNNETGGNDSGNENGVSNICHPKSTFCDQKIIRKCDASGQSSTAVESCKEECSFGRCITTRCKTAQETNTTDGCLFYGLDTDNAFHDDTQVFGFPIGNPGTAPVWVDVEKSVSEDTWLPVVSGFVYAGTINYFRIALGPKMGDDYHIEGTGQGYKAYRITSTGPIVAYQINADDEAVGSINSGSTLLLPMHVLGQHYYAITPPDQGAASFSHATFGPDHGFISVVGAKNNTKVTITVKGAVMTGGPIGAMAAGETSSFIINEGEVVQLETQGKGDDFSGSEIISDQPVVVYAGSVCGSFDPMRIAYRACDHIVETMYPTRSWGKNFVFLDMRMPEHLPSKSIWGRIVASENDTTVNFDSPRTLPGLPSATILKRGEVLALEITDSLASGGRAHFSILADKPIEVGAFIGDDEGGAIIAPTDQFLDDYLISTHPWFTGYIMITRKVGTPVTLNGLPVPDSVFAPGGNGYEVSYIPTKRCEGLLNECAHRVVGSNIGVAVTANGGSCNYCYVGGTAVKCVNKFTGCK